MAHLEKLETGKWRAVVELGRDPSTGKRKRVTRIVNGPKWKAEEALHELAAKTSKGEYVEADNITVAEWCKHWLKIKSHEVAESTLSSYRSTVESHIIPAFGNMKLQELKPAHIQQYQADKLSGGLKPRTVQAHHTVLYMLMDAAERLEVAYRNPVSSVRAPSPNKPKHTFLKPKQIQAIQKEAEKYQYMHDLVTTILHTGLRKGEAAGLCWDCVNLEEGTIFIKRELQHKKGKGPVVVDRTKTDSSTREISINNTVVSIFRRRSKEQKENRLFLAEVYNDHNLVFCKKDGQPLSYHYITSLFKKLASQAGYPEASIHDLRHTHATLLHQAGEDLKDIQARLGHAQFATTADIYAKANTKDRKIADRMEEILSV